jgi:hypothetical protein
MRELCPFRFFSTEDIAKMSPPLPAWGWGREQLIDDPGGRLERPDRGGHPAIDGFLAGQGRCAGC